MTAKRAFDLLGSVTGLFVLVPVFLCIALWIKADSDGPIFFRQDRVGRLGKLFSIFKFRTMDNETIPSGEQITVGNDPRITRSGKFLRKYKLDELPQLINVLKGDMSLVGPRPEVPKYMALYSPEIREKIISVLPGMTDLASIEYSDESEILATSVDPRKTYIETIMPAKARYYVRYVETHSTLLDTKIILLTLKKILT